MVTISATLAKLKGIEETGFYINKKWGDKIVEVKGISKRVSMFKLAVGKNTKI